MQHIKSPVFIVSCHTNCKQIMYWCIEVASLDRPQSSWTIVYAASLEVNIGMELLPTAMHMHRGPMTH